ncbi:MAG TPA: UDP-N-acetylmuramate dehydrogenase [Kofleriaceae bacterium]|jgi:UDP-N-acetylmuramate dehydrogenase|nr:UDP-N-acetylmuramate dehydrogenase [Kofleriaceae bacterium]
MPIENVRSDVPLAPLTTLGIGGPAKHFVRVTSASELADVLADADSRSERVLIIGGGSNLVVLDEGWQGLAVQIAIDGVRVVNDGDDFAIVHAAAGVVWDELVDEMVRQGLAGAECMSGIPGLVGATPMQNVGAYGQEVADTIVKVHAFDREALEPVTFAPAACEFAYRSSAFKGKTRYVITEVEFRLPRRIDSMPIKYAELAKALSLPEGATASLKSVRDTVIALRRKKGMVLDPGDPDSKSAGSFFMNPIVSAELAATLADAPKWPQPDGRVKLSAGWLIERAGFTKGTVRGNVGISSKHALALVNRGGATAQELLAFAHEIQDGVRTKLGVELVPEPVIV